MALSKAPVVCLVCPLNCQSSCMRPSTCLSFWHALVMGKCCLLRAQGEGQIVTVPRWLFALTPRVLSDTRRRDSNPGCSGHRLRARSPLSSHAVEVVCGEKCVPAVPASVQGWLQGSQELIHASSCSHTSSHARTSGSLHAENRITSCMISLTVKTAPDKLLLVCRAEGWSE